MDASTALTRLMAAIDAHRWDEIGNYLHVDFTCRYAHTGEVFDRAGWVRLNADYPGFQNLRVEEVVGDKGKAACRSRVSARGSTGLEHFECATFVTMRDGLIEQMTEIWTDMSQTAPAASRPVLPRFD